MIDPLLEAYDRLDASMQKFQNEYAKAVILVKLATEHLEDSKIEALKIKEESDIERQQWEDERDSIIEYAIADAFDAIIDKEALAESDSIGSGRVTVRELPEIAEDA